jgi:hypothetical protein
VNTEQNHQLHVARCVVLVHQAQLHRVYSFEMESPTPPSLPINDLYISSSSDQSAHPSTFCCTRVCVTTLCIVSGLECCLEIESAVCGVQPIENRRRKGEQNMCSTCPCSQGQIDDCKIRPTNESESAWDNALENRSV